LVEDLNWAFAAAAVAALGENGLFARPGEVGEDGFLVLGQDLGADGDLDDHGLAGGAAAVLAHAVVAAFGAEMLLVAEVDEGVEVLGRLHDHVAAAPAGAAVGAAELDELLAPEADRAGAAVAAAQVDLGLVEELHG
jgi:hypothetical protein